MLAKRPDVIQAEMGFRYAFEMRNVAQRSLYPSLTLGTSTIGYASNTLSQFFQPANILANIVGGLTPVSYTHLDVYKRQLLLPVYAFRIWI